MSLTLEQAQALKPGDKVVAGDDPTIWEVYEVIERPEKVSVIVKAGALESFFTEAHMSMVSMASTSGIEFPPEAEVSAVPEIEVPTEYEPVPEEPAVELELTLIPVEPVVATEVPPVEPETQLEPEPETSESVSEPSPALGVAEVAPETAIETPAEE